MAISLKQITRRVYAIKQDELPAFHAALAALNDKHPALKFDAADIYCATSRDCHPDRKDLANVARVIACAGHDMRFVSGRGWAVWNGTRWAFETGDAAAERRVQAAMERTFFENQYIDRMLDALFMINAELEVLKAVPALTADQEAFVETAGKVSRLIEWAKAKLEDEARVVNEKTRATARDARRASYTSHAKHSCSGPGVEQAMKRSVAHLTEKSDAFDSNPDLLGVANGVIDLSTGKFREASRRDMMTKSTGVAFDTAATCPNWLKFLDEVFQGCQEEVEFLQRSLGYAITGHTSEHKFWMLTGGGRNGKGTIFRRLQPILGDYYRVMPMSYWMVGHAQSSGHNDQLASLAGARLVVSDEAQPASKLDEAKIQGLSGESMQNASFKGRSGFDFMPTCKVMLIMNILAEIKSQNDAVWGRILELRFKQRFWDPNDKTSATPFRPGVDKPVNKKLDQILAKEHAGILNWLIEGAAAWYRDGLTSPASVTAQVATYRNDQDALRGFVATCIEFRDGFEASAGDLYLSYKNYTELNAAGFVMSQKAFGQALNERAKTLLGDQDGMGTRKASVTIRTRVRLTRDGEIYKLGLRPREEMPDNVIELFTYEIDTGKGRTERRRHNELMDAWLDYVSKVDLPAGGSWGVVPGMGKIRRVR